MSSAPEELNLTDNNIAVNSVLTNITINNKQKLLLLKGVLIWALATVFYFFDNLLNVSPGAMKPELSIAFSNSAAGLGALSASYLWAYGLMQIPAGLLMDKIGPRIVLSFASIMCAIGCYLFASAVNFNYAIAGRIFIGIGASFAFIGCCKLASVWFPPKRFALFTGLTVSVGMGGAAIGLATVNKIMQAFVDWRAAMFFGSEIALFLAIFMLLMLRDQQTKPLSLTNETVDAKDEIATQIGSLKAIKEIIFSSQAWYVAIYAGLMFMPTLTFGGLWGTPYLVEAHGFTRDEAGFLSGLIFIGWTFGGPIYGWLSDHIGRRNLPMLFSNITTLALTILIIYAKNLSMFQIGSLMFMLGFFSSGFVLAFAVIREKNRLELAGTAIGFTNMLNTFLGGAIFQQLIGYVLDLTATNVIHTAEGTMFSLGDYQTALLCIPVCLVVSLILLLLVKETYCKAENF